MGIEGVTSNGILIGETNTLANGYEPFDVRTCGNYLEIAHRFKWQETNFAYDYRTEEGFIKWIVEYSRTAANRYTEE